MGKREVENLSPPSLTQIKRLIRRVRKERARVANIRGGRHLTQFAICVFILEHFWQTFTASRTMENDQVDLRGFKKAVQDCCGMITSRIQPDDAIRVRPMDHESAVELASTVSLMVQLSESESQAMHWVLFILRQYPGWMRRDVMKGVHNDMLWHNLEESLSVIDQIFGMGSQEEQVSSEKRASPVKQEPLLHLLKPQVN